MLPNRRQRCARGIVGNAVGPEIVQQTLHLAADLVELAADHLLADGVELARLKVIVRFHGQPTNDVVGRALLAVDGLDSGEQPIPLLLDLFEVLLLGQKGDPPRLRANHMRPLFAWVLVADLHGKRHRVRQSSDRAWPRDNPSG